jgi:hypothetical protein
VRKLCCACRFNHFREKRPKVGTRQSHKRTAGTPAAIRSINLSPSSSVDWDVHFLVGTNIAITGAHKPKGNMKPISMIAGKSKRFPRVDCNYRPMTLDGYQARCARTEMPRFRNISGQYFQNEARHDFLVEAVCFAILIITAAVPLVSATNAVVELCWAFAQL